VHTLKISSTYRNSHGQDLVLSDLEIQKESTVESEEGAEPGLNVMVLKSAEGL
jgi:hypothetical protein